jgi:hypothetical protein
MSKLTSKSRNALADRTFGLPGERKYPLNDRAHQINAKSRATQMEKAGKLSPSSAAKIKSKANQLLHKGK